jgi:hypothetical protein
MAKKKSMSAKAAKRAKPTKSELTDEEIRKIKAALWAVPATPEGARARAAMLPPSFGRVAARLAVAPAATLVAEGDSWFDYLPGLDILDQLRLRHGYQIVKLSAAGDTLENIAYGTEIGRDFSRSTPQINVLVETVARVRPQVVVLSAGGNDIAGDELNAFLNHKDSGLTPLRTSYLHDVVHIFFKSAYLRLVQSIWAIDPTIGVVTHGYGRPIPDGRAVLNFSFNFRFIGPWLRPAFTRKDITGLPESTAIIGQVIDEFNTMLNNLQGELGTRFRYIDLRGLIKTVDWVNELHLTNDAYARVADAFHTGIQSLLAPPPVAAGS